MFTQAFFLQEAARCRAELSAIRSAGRTTSVAGALGWSVAAVLWGNGVVAAGRGFGHDQWITLIGVPLFGLTGWWRLARRGFRRHAIGLQFPRADGNRVLSVATLTAAVFAGGLAVAGLATGTHDGRWLRTLRTAIGTGFGEELIHRGVLVTVWASTGVSTLTVIAANGIAFGLWHWAGADHLGEIVGSAALAVPLVWLRLRFRSVLAPMAFHAATNLGGIFQ